MKKVLFVNGMAIGEQSGTGVTLQNLWSSWPKEDLLQLITAYPAPDCSADYQTLLVPKSFCPIPFSYYEKKARNAAPVKAEAQVNGSVARSGVRAALHDLLRGIMDCWPVRYAAVRKAVHAFHPDVIYTCGASARVMKTALAAAKAEHIPIILHLMDDWPETIYTTSLFSAPFRMRIQALLYKIHKKSRANFAISEALCEKYEQKYGVLYRPLMNPAMQIAEKPAELSSGELRFVYAGSLSLHRWKPLLEIAQVLCDRRECGMENRFDLYVPQMQLTQEFIELFSKSGAQLHPFVPADALRKIYEASDVLVYTESFEENVVQFTRLSLSTKIPEYLAAGKTVLAYLPPELHSCQYLTRRNAAMVCTTAQMLPVTIEKILRRDAACRAAAENGLETVRREHSAAASAEKIQETIAASC